MASDPVGNEEQGHNTITAGTDGVIRHWGREAENVFGYTQEEAIGQKVDLIIPPVLRARHWRGFGEAMENGHLRRGGDTRDLKAPARRKDGTIVELRSTLAVTHADGGTANGAMVTINGQGPSWRGTAWRLVLAPLKLGPLFKRRRPAD